METRDQILEQLVVTPGQPAGIAERDPGWMGGPEFADLARDELEVRAREALASGIAALSDAQELLWASDRYAVLVVLQAMDAAGKDSAIEHVMSGVNPQGVHVVSFKKPSAEELDHDFLWRTTLRLPRRGHIGIFNRSYYEEVLVVRVHQDLLNAQQLPNELVSKHIWEERYEDINNFEQYLVRNGVIVMKFFLHLSKGEQKRRFLERLEMPEKNWKFSMADVKERAYWKDYQKAYEEMIQNTATKHAPWYVIPADNKWFTRLAVAGAIIHRLHSLDLQFPEVDDDKKKELALVRKALLAGKE
jgi:PPK2 family polyphosphate:nucleotide phosphotransferase